MYKIAVFLVLCANKRTGVAEGTHSGGKAPIINLKILKIKQCKYLVN